MRTYADARHCPDCGSSLPAAPHRCPSCGLGLDGPKAAALFATFQEADRLLAELRTKRVAVPVGVRDGGPAAPLGPVGPPTGTLTAEEAPRATAALPPTPQRSGLSGASVPRILLTLGALCLLVAAVTFLAVAWEFLGVGGRTAVLVGFTVTAGVLTAWGWRRGLRAAAEALSVVTAGLMVLDLVGAADAGWLPVEDGGLLLTIGLVLGVTGLAVTYPAREHRPLWAPQVVGALGFWVAPAGALALTSHDSAVLAVSTVALGAMTAATHARRVGLFAWFLGAGATLWWAALTLTGVVRLTEHPDAADLWAGLHPWPLLVAALIAGVAAVAARSVPLLASAVAGVAATLAVMPLLAPALDNSATQAASATLVAALAFAIVALRVPAGWRVAGLLPTAVALVIPVGLSIAATGLVLETVFGVGEAWSQSVSVRLPETATTVHPALLPATMAVICLAATALFRPSPAVTRAAAPSALTLVLLAGVTAAAAYPIPLASLVAALLVLGLGLGAWSLRLAGLPGDVGLALATAVLAAALLTGLPSVVLTAITLALLVLAAGAVAALATRPQVRAAGWGSAPVLVAALVWALAEIGDLDTAWRATPALVVLGLAALLAPRPAVEVPAALAAVVVTTASVSDAFAASDSRGLVVLAVDLTVAGGFVTASSLAHPHRRLLAVPGGLLLAMATWVRLYDLDVTAPEAYTLPSALVLIALGLRHLKRNPEAPTLTYLGPGLALATVPTMLRALVDDPVSWRPLVLGLVALGLVLVGVRLRWTAPLVVGGGVGAVIVVRELGPYAADLPPWLLIAVAGALLTGIGVTWESRMNDVRRAGRYLARLR